MAVAGTLKMLVGGAGQIKITKELGANCASGEISTILDLILSELLHFRMVRQRL